MLKSYLKKVYEIASRGDAREESYYSTLEELLGGYAESIGKRNIHVTTLPKRTEAGNPDFRVWDGNQHIAGYIEAKAPTVEHLDQIETTEQLKRYLHTFPNLILTNFFEFRLYRNGNLIDKALIARPYVVHKLKTVPPAEKESEFFQLLEKFLSFSLPKVYDAKALAIELAKRTRFLRDEVIAEELKTVEQTFLSDNDEKETKMSEWKINQAGEGVLGFVTNHSYLDNPTFRGMRQSLMNSFNEIYILDLHGNSLKKEKCPDGSKDENVFDIQQGVAIALFIKEKGKMKGCNVYHSEIWGLREYKYSCLLENNIKTTKWKRLFAQI